MLILAATAAAPDLFRTAGRRGSPVPLEENLQQPVGGKGAGLTFVVYGAIMC